MQMVLCTSPDSATLDQANASVKQASNSIKKLESQLLFLQDVHQEKEDKKLDSNIELGEWNPITKGFAVKTK